MPVHPEATFGHRFKERILSRFGWRWVPGRELAVILRNERFHRIERGPKELWLAVGAERVAFTLEILPDKTRFPAEKVNTADGPQVTVVLQLEYRFAPWTLPPSEQGFACMRCKTPDEQRKLVEDNAQRAAQEVFSHVPAVDACSGHLSFSNLEPQVFDLIDDRLKPFALSLLRPRCSIQEIECPESLKDKLEKMVERRMNIKLVQEFGEQQVGQALRAEAVESLSKMTSGSPYLNVHDLTDVSPGGAAKPPAPLIIDHLPHTAESPPVPKKPDPEEPPSLIED